MSEFVGNRIWVGGVQIDIMSGDVSALHGELKEATMGKPQWFDFPTPHGQLSFHVGPTTDIVVDYFNG